MELAKFNEAYKLTDSTLEWSTKGQVVREDSGLINITFTVQKETTYIGKYMYSVSAENQNVSASYNCERSYTEPFLQYSENLINEILQSLNTSTGI